MGVGVGDEEDGALRVVAIVLSPKGAAVNSQGREPLESGTPTTLFCCFPSPNGATLNVIQPRDEEMGTLIRANRR